MTSTDISACRILVLATSESAVRSDIGLLRLLGTGGITCVPACADALELLRNAAPGFDFVICDDKLERHELYSFLQGLSLAPEPARAPVLLLSSGSKQARELSDIGIAALARPCTADQLREALLQSRQNPLPDAGKLRLPEKSRPKKKANRVLTTSDLFTSGMEALRKADLDAADAALRECLRRSPNHANAAIALAKVRREQGNIQAMHRFLLRAAVIFQREGDLARRDAVIQRLPEGWRNGSLYYHDALASLRAGDYAEAAEGFCEYQETSKGLSMQNILARACQFTDDPEFAITCLCDAFERRGKGSTAAILRSRLLCGSMAVLGEKSPGWLSRFPLLQDAVNVVAFTALAWKAS